MDDSLSSLVILTCKKCGWEWDAADGGDDITTCHKCGGQGLVHAQDGGDYIEILKWLEEFKIPDTTYLFGLHTQNPVGRMNMKAIIEHNNWRLI